MIFTIFTECIDNVITQSVMTGYVFRGYDSIKLLPNSGLVDVMVAQY